MKNRSVTQKSIRLPAIVVLSATVLLLTLLLFVGCGKSPENPTPPPENLEAWFEDVSEEVGLDFVHDAGPVDEAYFMPQITGSGSALFDFDGDGRLDILLLNNGGPKGRPNQLFKQLENGKFVNVSTGSGLDYSGYCQGVAIGDVNNDGLPDVLITEYGSVRLFLNTGKGTFKDITLPAGLSNPFWATSAAFVDFDRDGRLDLVIVNYLAYNPSRSCDQYGKRDYCSPGSFAGIASKLYRNLGPDKGAGVRFEDVTVPSGFVTHPGPGLGVVCADFTGDGWPDFFIANDGVPNHLWVNQKDGTFKEEAAIRGLASNAMGKAEANMGIAWGDVDGDGLQDVFVTHLNVETNTLWIQKPRGLFQDRTARSALNRPNERATGFGTILGDFNCDGSLDAAILNGGVTRLSPSETGPRAFFSQYFQRNQIFMNDGSGRFSDRSSANAGPKGFCGYGNVGRGLSTGDIANDGTIWLLATEVGGRARLFKNVAPNRGHWVVLRAFDPALRRDALDSEITVLARNRKWVSTVQTNGGYLTSKDARVHVGLGAVESIDSVQVRWPDGMVEEFAPPALDSHAELRRGAGKPVTLPK